MSPNIQTLNTSVIIRCKFKNALKPNNFQITESTGLNIKEYFRAFNKSLCETFLNLKISKYFR